MTKEIDYSEFVDDSWFAESRKYSVEMLGEEEVLRIEKETREMLNELDKELFADEQVKIAECLYIYLYGVKPDKQSSLWSNEHRDELMGKALNILKVKYGPRLNLPDHPRTDNL